MLNEPVNPDMIVLCREAAGLTQTRLATELGVSQGRVSKIEQGSIAAPPALVPAIANTLGVPVSALTRRSSGNVPMIYHKKLASAGKQQVRKIHATINLRRLEVLAMLDLVRIEYVRSVPSLTAKSPENAAGKVRDEWGVAGGPAPSVMTLLERAGVIPMAWDFGTFTIKAVSLRGDAESPHFIFYNQALPPDYLRFVLAHELGHLVMHHGYRRDGMEPEADEFAGAFLMPAADVRLEMPTPITLEGLFGIKARWKVEAGSLLYRAGELGLLTSNRKRRLWMEYSRRGYRGCGKEPQTMEMETPMVVSALIRHFTNTLGYSSEQLRGLLRVSTGIAQEVYGFGPPQPIKPSLDIGWV